MKKCKTYEIGGSISSLAALDPDPASKAALMAIGPVVSFLEGISKDADLNQNYMTRQGSRNIMEMGGEIPAMVEKDEVVRTPFGQTTRIKGGTHESGNDTLIMAHPGTDVFSASISVKGKTMADMEEERSNKEKKSAKRLKKIYKDMADRPNDQLVKNGAALEVPKIMHEILEMQNERDAHMMVQEILSGLEEDKQGSGEMKMGGRIKKYELGTGVPDRKAMLAYLNQIKLSDPGQAEQLAAQTGFDFDGFDYVDNNANLSPIKSDYNDQGIGAYIYDDQGLTPEEKVKTGVTHKKDPNLATRVKGYADLGTFALDAILGPKDEPNFFSGYGQKALNTNTKTLDSAAIERDRNVQEENLARNSMIKHIANNSQSGSSFLANVLGVEAEVQNQKNNISANYDQSVNSILGQRASLYNEQDSKVMTGAQNQFDSKEKRLDNAMTMLSRAIKNAATSEMAIDKTSGSNSIASSNKNQSEEYMKWLTSLLGGGNISGSTTSRRSIR